MAKKALNIHEAFANNLAFENHILWDAYTSDQFNLFKNKLNELIRDDGNAGSDKSNVMEKIRERIYKSTISQAKYTNRNLLTTFILVTVAPGKTFLEARDATTFSVHLIIRTRKCMKHDDSSRCCMIFIDEHGRVYQNWKAFVNDNLLPGGVAFAPYRGIYTYENGKLSMESWVTPSSKLNHKALIATDIAAGVTGVGAAGVALATLAIPVAAPVLAGATIVGIGTGIYTAVRSGFQLISRSEHEQSIALTDRTARTYWLSLVSGAFVIGSSVANRAIASVAIAGREVTLVEETIVNGMNISSMLLSGTDVANGVVDIILKVSDDEEITRMDVLQLASSLAIFTHSIYNFRLASTIIEQNSKSYIIKTKISSRIKQAINKVTQGLVYNGQKIDVIRLPNEIPETINSAFEIGSKIIGLYSLTSNVDRFIDCLTFINQQFGNHITNFLIEKTEMFMNCFRSTIEEFLKTNLYFENVLWDLYKICEKISGAMIKEVLEKNKSTIFDRLLDHYKKMSFFNSKADCIKCKICNGYYTVTL